MAARNSTATPVQHVQHERFTTQEQQYQLTCLSLDLSGNIAVSGFNCSSKRTFIDLYNSDSRDKLKLFYSKEFETYSSHWPYRHVSFLDKNVSKLVTCINDKIEIIDTKKESKMLRSCTLNDEINCLAVREGEIFIGLIGPQTVFVFDIDLKQTKEINIKGIQVGDQLRDLQVVKDTMFVCTTMCRALSVSVSDTSNVSKYTDATEMYNYAHSTAVSEDLSLLAVVWGMCQIVVSSLNENKCLLVFDVDNDITRIRISDRDRMIITGNYKTGEVKMYDLGRLFSFEAMKKTLARIVSPKECEKLRQYFGVTEEEIRRLETGDEYTSMNFIHNKPQTIQKMQCLLTILERKGHLNPYNINALTDAVSNLGDESHISNLKGPIEGYCLHGILKVKSMNLLAEMMTRYETWEDERNQLSSKLETAESKVKEHEKTVNDLQGELAHAKTQSQEEQKAIQEDLEKAKQQIKELEEGKMMRSVGSKSLVDSEETRDGDGVILEPEFGRLTVAIAEALTLDLCLKLAYICNIPASDCDTFLCVSTSESPGMKLLDMLKKRKVINMFDVTNLQKALAVLHLEAVNHDLVAPYQEKIDKEQYELYKVEEINTWKGVDAFTGAVKDDTARQQVRDGQVSLIGDNKPESTSQAEAAVQPLEAEEHGRGSLLGGRHHHQLYTEDSIGREGGIIHLVNVSLTVPPDALHESHVIALSVMNESPFPLDREVDTARMTPLIKLEPLGLKFKKSLQLSIPHSALIFEPDHHDVIIYSGQITKNNEDLSDFSITWTEEKSIPRQLKEKSVTVDIQCLTYLSASLVSQISVPPLYIVRAVPFVDGVRNTDDDIILTICFCSDNELEYNMLLSDFKSKLPLERYSTLQLHRHSERDEDDAGFLSMAVTSINDTYVPDSDQAVKKFAISHLCTASRVSHQLRIRKNQDEDRNVVDIVLTFSQAESTPTRIFMKAEIKDLMISQESEDLLIGSMSTAIKPYEDLKANISEMLENDHCNKIATYFELSPAETEKVMTNVAPGRKLIKILDEREKIMPEKLFDLYQGLKVCHLDKIARRVLEYIESKANETPQGRLKNETDQCLRGTSDPASGLQRQLQEQQRTVHSSLSDQSVQTTLSSSCVSSDVHVKTLTNEGYTEHEVVEALDISRNRLVMARKVLQCLGEQLDGPHTKDSIFLHKEQYIDENGGEIILQEANVHLMIPVGAVSKGSIVSLTMMTCKQGNVQSEGRTPQLSPVIKLGPEGSVLNKNIILRIPHCAADTEGITSTDMYIGFTSNGKKFQWRERKLHEPKPVLERDHFEVSVQLFCAISMKVDVDFKKPLSKKFRVLPMISRIVNPCDDLIVTLWIYNDDETEHMHLLHDEININGNMQLHDCKQFTLKGSEKEKEVNIRSGSNKITPCANVSIQKVLSTTLWHNTRNAVKFHFQNKEGVDDISFRLRLCSRQVLRTLVDLQFDVKVTLPELVQKPQQSMRTLRLIQEPHPAMERSFQELIKELSGQLDAVSCEEIAGIFRLSSDWKDRVKECIEPGKALFDKLIQERLITAANVSALDVVLTRTGHVHLAEQVTGYRHKNVTFPTTVYTLL